MNGNNHTDTTAQQNYTHTIPCEWYWSVLSRPVLWPCGPLYQTAPPILSWNPQTSACLSTVALVSPGFFRETYYHNLHQSLSPVIDVCGPSWHPLRKTPTLRRIPIHCPASCCSVPLKLLALKHSAGSPAWERQGESTPLTPLTWQWGESFCLTEGLQGQCADFIHWFRFWKFTEISEYIKHQRIFFYTPVN